MGGDRERERERKKSSRDRVYERYRELASHLQLLGLCLLDQELRMCLNYWSSLRMADEDSKLGKGR